MKNLGGAAGSGRSRIVHVVRDVPDDVAATITLKHSPARRSACGIVVYTRWYEVFEGNDVCRSCRNRMGWKRP